MSLHGHSFCFLCLPRQMLGSKLLLSDLMKTTNHQTPETATGSNPQTESVAKTKLVFRISQRLVICSARELPITQASKGDHPSILSKSIPWPKSADRPLPGARLLSRALTVGKIGEDPPRI